MTEIRKHSVKQLSKLASISKPAETFLLNLVEQITATWQLINYKRTRTGLLLSKDISSGGDMSNDGMDRRQFSSDVKLPPSD